MASKNSKKTTTANGSYKRGQSQPQWTDLPNNLDLRSIPQSSKKQRNKDGLTDQGKSSFQNMHGSNSNRHFPTNHPSNKLSLAAWQSEQQLVADSEHEEVNHQNLFRQHRQNSHYQNTQHASDGSRSLCESNASKQYKEDNTKKTPDTSIIVERLMHLRDCIKQVSSIMNNLEKTDEPVTRDQMKRLNNMLKQLQQEEQQHFDLLQQMLVTNEEASASSNSPDRAYVIPSNDIENNVKEQNGELEETIEHGQRLMRKMIESQEKMESLKKQQAELLSMQKQAEDKLAEAKSFHVTLMKKEAAVKNQIGRCNYPLDWKNKESDRLSNNIEAGTNKDNEIQPMWQIRRNSEENSMNDGNQAINWSADIPSSGLEVTFENLKQRLEHLKDLAYNKTSEEANEKISEMKDSKSELHRKKLENKLKEIQAKKKHMDKMLVELSALEQASVNVKNSQSNTTQFVTADSTIQEAQHLLDTIDAREKVKKLEEMKESLSQLRAMVNSIQPMNGDVSSINNEDHVETISNSSKSSSQVIKHRSDSKIHQNSQQISQVKKDNIRQDHSNKFPVRRHYEAEGRANEDGDNLTPVSSVQDGNSGIDEYWENDPQVQEKVRKLKEAKQKLQRLQSLMSAVQNSKDNGDSATMEYLQLLSAISDEERQEILENNSQLNSNDLNGFGDGEMIETQNQHKDMIRLEAVEEKMQQQQEELEKLMEERKKLLHMQTQLTKLQHQFPNSSSISDERNSMQQKSSKKVCGNANSLSSRTLSPCRQIRSDNYILGRQNLSYEQPNTNMKSRSNSKKTVSKKDNINSMSANLSGRIKDGKDDVLNSDVNENNAMDTLLIQANELDNTLMLQEIKQNVLLEDILRQNHKHQEYSNNEDIRSQSGSSANSEFQEESNSILAPDTTAAATWGGSSTQNDFEDEPVESLEEQDGSETEVPCDGNLWQAQNKVQSIQQPYMREMMQTEQSTVTRQNDNRISSQQNFKSEGINRWNVKKNFQDQQRNHINSTHNQDNLYGANRLNLEEPMTSQNLLLSDGTCNLAVWQQFTQHIHQQLEHMNTLCQSIFQDQQTLTSCLQSCSLSSPSLAIGRPSYPVFSDILHQHTHQFQQQQQLLLSLSQCYHMIYLQQLEIQYLHQCLQQSSSSEQAVPQASPNINQDRINEEFTFCPWLTAQSANTNSSFAPVQASPVSTSCVHSNTANTLLPTSNSTPNRFNLTAPVSSNCNFARQTAVAATLNNQVPPRTRANNFWDNFRSCSRQNMLSTSKSNEIINANLSNPQIPDSTTTVCDHQVQMKNQSYSEKTANSDYFRAKTRHVSNAKMQENINKSKKPNSSKDRGLFSCFVNKASSTQQLTSKSKSLSEKSIRPKQSSASRVSDNNSISNVPIFADSNNSILSPFSNAKPREVEVKSTGNTNTMQESVYAEVSKIISQADGQPEFLLDFLKKLKHLRLDSQQAFSGSQHTSINPKEETEVATSVAAATGAVRKRTYNKRAKLEHISLPQVNGIGRNSDHNENSNEKSEPLSSNQEDSENKAEQEVKDVVGMDLNSLICQSSNRTAQIAEEDMIYECDPEGETEPYIEAETDDTKDLAEADQSPGQRTSVVDHVQHFRQIESPQLVSSLGNTTNNFLVNSGLRNESLSSIPVAIDGLEDGSVDQQDIAAGGEQIQSCLDNDQTIDELPLDDIPTKLIPLSEGELSKQMTEEISAASLIQEMISEELSDVVKEQSHF